VTRGTGSQRAAIKLGREVKAQVTCAILAALLLPGSQTPSHAACTGSGTALVTCSGVTNSPPNVTGTGSNALFDFLSDFKVTTGFLASYVSSGNVTAEFAPGASTAVPSLTTFSAQFASGVTVDLAEGASFGRFVIQGNSSLQADINGTSDSIFAGLSRAGSRVTVGGTVNGTTFNFGSTVFPATITLGTGTVEILEGGFVDGLNSSATAIQIQNAGVVINAGTVDGRVRLLGSNGRVELRPTGTFNQTVQANRFDLGGSGNATFDLSGIGSKYLVNELGKIGTSTWTVTGAPLSNAPWTIEDGTLIVAAGANLGGGDVTVEGGTLKGFGTVGNLVNLGGTVRPGGSIGTLHVAGDFSQGADGTTAIELDPPQTSLLDVTGSASLAGKLLAMPDPGSYMPGSIFTFLTTGGSVTGTFNPVASALPALVFDAIYGSNFASLVFLGYDFSQFAETPNQKSVANAIDEGTGNEEFNELLYDLAALPSSQIPFGLDQLGNEVATVFPDVTQEDRRTLLASFIDRLGPSCLDKGKRFGADPLALAPTVWSRGFYREDDNSQTGGATVGLEAHPDKWTCAGLGFNYANTDLALDGLPQSGEVEAFSLGAYARRDWALLFADGAAAATYASIDSTRHILFAGQTAKGDTEATGAGLIAGIGLVLRAGAFTFEPRIGLDYDHNDQKSFVERGSAANLRVSGEDRDALRSNLGTRLHAIWNLASGATLMPEFTVAWAHDFLDPTVALKERFLSAQNAAFLIKGEDPPDDFFLLGAGLSYHPNAADEVFVRYDGAWAADDTRGNAISAGAKFHW
jgi:outer membrane autotransporter protein